MDLPWKLLVSNQCVTCQLVQYVVVDYNGACISRSYIGVSGAAGASTDKWSSRDEAKMSMTSLRWATGSNRTHAASTVSSKLNITQLNLDHNKAATAVLRQQLKRLDNAVALIKEPWVRGNRILGLNVRSGNIMDLLMNILEHA